MFGIIEGKAKKNTNYNAASRYRRATFLAPQPSPLVFSYIPDQGSILDPSPPNLPSMTTITYPKGPSTQYCKVLGPPNPYSEWFLDLETLVFGHLDPKAKYPR